MRLAHSPLHGVTSAERAVAVGRAVLLGEAVVALRAASEAAEAAGEERAVEVRRVAAGELRAVEHARVGRAEGGAPCGCDASAGVLIGLGASCHAPPCSSVAAEWRVASR